LYQNDVKLYQRGSTGDDSFPHYANMAVSARILRGDVIRMTMTIVHDQFAGQTTYEADMSITSTSVG